MMIKNKAGRIWSVSDETYKDLIGLEGYLAPTPEEDYSHTRLNQGYTGPSRSIHFPYWSSPLSMDGYGGSALEMQKHAPMAGLRFEDKYNGQDIALVYQMPEVPFRYLRDHDLKPNTKMVAFTMWETSELPGPYVKSLESADAIIVPCQWNKDQYQKQLPNKDIYVVPLGINMSDFPTKKRTPPKGKFRFLMYNAGNQRKGFPEYLDAFLAEFGPDENVEFVVKTLPGWEDKFFRYGQYMNQQAGRNIKLIASLMTRKEQLELLYGHDCFVFPSKGEGFSLPPIEASASGMPVILTKAHAHLSFETDDFYWVSTTEEPANIEPLIPKINLAHPERSSIDAVADKSLDRQWRNTGVWYKPDQASLQAQMRQVYENRTKACQRGLKASQYVHRTFTYENTVKELAKVLNIICPIDSTPL